MFITYSLNNFKSNYLLGLYLIITILCRIYDKISLGNIQIIQFHFIYRITEKFYDLQIKNFFQIL
jgi:hypothetical protein